jgi:hypothetical protein
MQTCETCRHWERWKAKDGLAEPYIHPTMVGPVGDCILDAPRMMTEGEIVTRADFGCIAHEPRENQTT